MSVYIKRMLVIKEIRKGYADRNKTVSGIVRIEQSESRSLINISIMNIIPVTSGSYYAVIKGAKDLTFIIDLGAYPMTFSVEKEGITDIESGVSCLILHSENQTVTTVAFGSSGGEFAGFNDLQNKFVSEYLLPQITPKITYADEEIAESNYFEKEVLKSYVDGLNEEVACTQVYNDDGGTAYYDKNKKDLESLFDIYPKNEQLCNMIKNSKWVKIGYGENKFYTVGIIYDNGLPKYICYGVPAKYSKTPPSAFDGCASFLPISLFDIKGDGYWMMYQSVKTGECVKMS